MKIKNIVKALELKPELLFLIDGLGASLTVFMLGIVLVKLERFFGIPSTTLYFLASIPVLFALYDFYCYKKGTKNLAPFLKGIAIMNLLYCFLSIGFAFYHSGEITIWGWLYIIIEILIIITLVVIELRVANKLIRNKA